MSLSIQNLNAFYGRAHVLHDLSLEVKQGDVVALLGRNGAGKSTTMKSIMGLVTATGNIDWNSKKIAGLKNYQIARSGIGYVPEERRIFGHLTVMENLLVGEKNKGEWDVPRILRLFPKIDELKDRAGRFLSGGEQQMLTIARTLMSNPTCLLLDEPTEGLAPIIVQQVIEAMSELKKSGIGILIAEQGGHMKADLVDRLYILEKGVAVFSGTPADLSVQPDMKEQYLAMH